MSVVTVTKPKGGKGGKKYDPRDATYGGVFRDIGKGPRGAIRDDEDDVYRCTRCTWEVRNGMCEHWYVSL